MLMEITSRLGLLLPSRVWGTLHSAVVSRGHLVQLELVIHNATFASTAMNLDTCLESVQRRAREDNMDLPDQELTTTSNLTLETTGAETTPVQQTRVMLKLSNLLGITSKLINPIRQQKA